MPKEPAPEGWKRVEFLNQNDLHHHHHHHDRRHNTLAQCSGPMLYTMSSQRCTVLHRSHQIARAQLGPKSCSQTANGKQKRQ